MSADKKALRKELALRRDTARGDADPAPALASLSEVLVRAAGPISFYWPIRSELDPRPVMEAVAERKRVCLPVTQGLAALTFRPWTPGATMEVDGFGVEVPRDGPEVTPKTLVIPMLGFDRTGQRLGYGAGHYDRTLEALRSAGPVLAIGLAYAAQEVEALPTEPTDQPLDVIVTEAGVLTF